MHRRNRPLASAPIAATLISAAVLSLATGCDSQEMLQQVIEQARAATPGAAAPAGSLTATLGDGADGVLAEDEFSMPPPSPGRNDPFRYPDDFQTTQPSGERTGRGEVKLLGFVQTDRPKVLLTIEGQSGTLAVGESLGRVTVESISIPNVRLSLDGVTWNASLFDRSGS